MEEIQRKLEITGITTITDLEGQTVYLKVQESTWLNTLREQLLTELKKVNTYGLDGLFAIFTPRIAIAKYTRPKASYKYISYRITDKLEERAFDPWIRQRFGIMSTFTVLLRPRRSTKAISRKYSKMYPSKCRRHHQWIIPNKQNIVK